ncbi:uncharacterized protein EI97DRAFT_436791 [Westerdykella ornata]|uniref:Uncharacterized protein n=1 Tax=Westerdykella ornata TaxID=318751 RepID=A0A6A6J999_WESOR|nr:uncharacterized protein EI97DRAFT_436791 [Westerdykella ornata]KAF2272548.1 hypothetical protein EI97DRAFT_436791 [Westerdykella ornata]
MPTFMKPRYVGRQIATELAEAAYRKMFKYQAEAYVDGEDDRDNIRQFLAIDLFGVGVTPIRFLRSFRIQWDVQRLTKSKLERCRWDLQALRLLEPCLGLDVTVTLITPINKFRLLRLGALLEAFAPVQEHFERRGIRYRIVAFYLGLEIDVKRYFRDEKQEWYEWLYATIEKVIPTSQPPKVMATSVTVDAIQRERQQYVE